MTHNPPDPDPFEQEIREALAREAGDPAPQRLVARIARSRADSRPSTSGLAGLRARLAPALRARGPLGAALVAVVVLAFAGTNLLRPPESGTTPILPGASDGPNASGVPNASDAPGASAPVATPTAAPPASAPAVTASPAAEGPAAGSVPADFQPVSVTFVSASRGWVLGSSTCAGSPCATILRTTDGGVTWGRIPAPAAPIAPGGRAATGVSGLRFGSQLDGWAFGPDLWATHDGGATWHREALPGAGAATEVMALEAAAGKVHVAFYASGSEDIAIASGPIDGDVVRPDPTTVSVGAGPVPETRIVLHGPAGWLVQVNRAVVGGARLANDAWQAWQPPCLDTAGPAWLAASSGSDLVAACDMGVWSTPLGVHLFTSNDGGATFTQQATAIPITGLAGIAAAPSKPTVVAAGSVPGGNAALVATLDGGRTWARVATLATPGGFSELGFTTAEQGVAIARTGENASHLVMTRDGGRTWAAVDFGAG